jgi:hypothetical protein
MYFYLSVFSFVRHDTWSGRGRSPDTATFEDARRNRLHPAASSIGIAQSSLEAVIARSTCDEAIYGSAFAGLMDCLACARNDCPMEMSSENCIGNLRVTIAPSLAK